MNEKTVTLNHLLEAAQKSEALTMQVVQAVQTELNKRPTQEQVNTKVAELFTSVSDGKNLIASAITDKGVTTAADASFQTMRENILAIESGGSLPENVYQINVSASTAEGGTVSGGGVASEGMMLTVSANVAEGYNFEGWQENGEVVSADESYNFTVTGNRALSAVFSVKVSHNLPEGYTEVEYIESTSTCYVSIGLKMNYATTVLELDIEPKNYYEGEEYFFSVSGGSGKYVNVSRKSENIMSYRYYGAYAKQFEKNVSNQRIHVVYDGPSKEIRIGDSAFSIDTDDSTTLYNATIFSYNSGSSSRAPISFLYGATLETDGTMIGHFIPCINPSGVAGLYDIIRNKFYGNAGTGSFTAGPAV